MINRYKQRWQSKIFKGLGKKKHLGKENAMTLCPIALAAGCKKCPMFSICPLKTVIGDYRTEPKPDDKQCEQQNE